MTFGDFILEWRNSNDYIEACTSGSTGVPKIIHLPKKFVIKSAERTNNFFGIDSDSRLHSCVSPDFIGGKMMAVRSEISNSRLTYETSTNQPLKGLDKNERIDLLAVVPSQMLYLIEQKDSLPQIKNIIIGGSAIHPNLREKIAESGLNAYETYGMTETASHIALRKISKENIPFKVFKDLDICKNQEDCLEIKFPDGMSVKTNDLVEIVSPKEFYIKGRKDNVIITGGRKVNPLEIEEKLSHVIYTPFLITGIDDEKWGKKIVLVIEGKQDCDLKTKLFSLMPSLLEKWQIPKDIYFIKSLPLTPNGKLNRGVDFCFDEVDPGV